MRLSGRGPVVLASVVIVAFGVLAFLTFTSVGHRGTPRQQLETWVRGTGLGQTVGQIEGDSGAISTVVARHDGSAAVHTTCAVLLDDSSSATAKLPSPDTTVTQLLARGYQLEYQGADDCYQAGAANTRLLTRSARERASGLELLGQALELVDRRSGRTVATTTTTTPSSGGLFG